MSIKSKIGDTNRAEEWRDIKSEKMDGGIEIGAVGGERWDGREIREMEEWERAPYYCR